MPNAFADGAPTHVWHHLACGAAKRPEALESALSTYDGDVPDKEALLASAKEALSKQKPKVPFAERASTGRSKCMSCEESIAKGDLRIAVEREVDTGSFVTKSAGFLHLSCASMFVGDPDLLDDVKAHSRGLSAEDVAEIEEALAAE